MITHFLLAYNTVVSVTDSLITKSNKGLLNLYALVPIHVCLSSLGASNYVFVTVIIVCLGTTLQLD